MSDFMGACANFVFHTRGVRSITSLLAALNESNADYLTTGDKDLLVLGSYEGIPIMTPSKFLSLI